MADPILKIKNLNVEYPLFGGILQKEVSCVHAVKNLSIDKIEAIDMGRKGIHNEGARVLLERLETRVETDTETARRMFTLIYALTYER